MRLPRLNCRRAYDVAASVKRGAPAVCKITLSDQRRVKILNFAKTQGRQLGVEHVRFKMAPERLSHGGDARSKGLALDRGAFLQGARLR
jgi:hypothetical protein